MWYLAFCSQFHMNLFLLSEAFLCRFVAYLYPQNLFLFSKPLLEFPLLVRDRFMWTRPTYVHLPQLHQHGLQQQQLLYSRPHKLPITFSSYSSTIIARQHTPPPHPLTSQSCWVAYTLAFFSFLRCGEFTFYPITEAHLNPTILPSTTVPNPSFATAKLHHSKTDQLGVGSPST